MSLQTGKPWMIEGNAFINSSETWYRDPLAALTDQTLAAFIALRLTTADVLEAFGPQRLPHRNVPAAQSNELAETLTRKIREWITHWCGPNFHNGKLYLSVSR